MSDLDAEDEALGEALMGFFTNSVDLPTAPDLPAGSIWWQERDGWLYPWRMTGLKQGYPCGEPRQKRK